MANAGGDELVHSLPTQMHKSNLPCSTKNQQINKRKWKLKKEWANLESSGCPVSVVRQSSTALFGLSSSVAAPMSGSRGGVRCVDFESGVRGGSAVTAPVGSSLAALIESGVNT